MAINFPSSPTTGQTFTNNNTTWKWSGTVWQPVSPQTYNTVVVSTPVFSTPNQATVGQTVVVKAKSNSLLSDVAIKEYRIGLPSGIVTVAADALGFGQSSFVTSGTVGNVITVTAQAIDDLNNVSNTNTYDITLSTSFVNKATITSPLTEATLVENGLSITTAAFAATGASDTLDRTEFEIRDASDVLLWSSSALAALTVAVPDDTIAAGATVFIRARHVGVSLGNGQWSDVVQITTAPILTPANYGDAYQGGYYAGRIKMSGNLYAIVVAPASSETVLASATGTAGSLTTGAKSLVDGLANTNDLILNSTSFWPAASYCYNASINGYTDWYLPSLLELELAYRTLKPNETLNSVSPANGGSTVANYTSSWGGNITLEWSFASGTLTPTPPAIPTNYTNTSGIATLPSMTASQLFQSSQSQQAFASDTYWSSSGPSNVTTGREHLACFRFTDGYAVGNGSASAGDVTLTTQTRRVRPFRRVFLRTEP